MNLDFVLKLIGNVECKAFFSKDDTQLELLAKLFELDSELGDWEWDAIGKIKLGENTFRPRQWKLHELYYHF